VSDGKRAGQEAAANARDPKRRAEVPDRLVELGGLKAGNAREVADATGVSEARVYGVGSFFHLLAEPEIQIRVCTGLSCQMKGADAVLEAAKAAGLPAAGCQCLAACDRPVPVLRERRVLPEVTVEDVERAEGDYLELVSSAAPDDIWLGHVGPAGLDPEKSAFGLEGELDFSGKALARALELGAEKVFDELQASGLQGRGGAGFPAHIKWRAVAGQPETTRYVVLNADEGEPGTFKDRELLVRRPDLVLEGLVIAARMVGAQEIYCYLRGEFEIPWEAMATAISEFRKAGLLNGLEVHLHAGHGAYICGEETALLEALEGKRGMPRLKPPFPVEKGRGQKPTLVHNVETIAAVPGIVMRGGAWFAGLGRTGPGAKLYCISGDVVNPGVYELPLGVSLDELVEAAGGYDGELMAFSPGGASSGFLPPSERGRALDFKSLSEVGSMLGSAGCVVMNTSRDLKAAVLNQLTFFMEESCGQCAPCRIGTRFQREAFVKHLLDGKGHLELSSEVAWEMNEGSICGLGQIASLPLTSAMRWFPEVFE